MVAIVRTEWAGASGGPGLTQFALLGAAGGEWNPGGEQAAVNAVRTFWFALSDYLPDELTLTVKPEVDTYNTETGVLFASNSAPTAPAVVAGNNVGSYAAASGLKITWNTGSIRDGRRVRGSTFIVPIAASSYSVTGTISAPVVTAVNTAATDLIAALSTASLSLAVWSRPRVLPTPREGAAFDVESGRCNTKSAILRGRRD